MVTRTTWSLKEENGARQERRREGKSLLVMAEKAEENPAPWGGEVVLSWGMAGLAGLTGATPGLILSWGRREEEDQDIGR